MNWTRVFVLTVLASFLVSCLGATEVKENIKPEPYSFPVPARAKGQTDVLELRCAPIKNVRIAFVGLGMRGHDAVRRYSYIEGSTISALVDSNPKAVDRALALVQKQKGKAFADTIKTFKGEEDWKKVCEDPEIDMIYVCTNWKLHFDIAIYAMEHGKHVMTEVPAAMTIEQCWKLIDTAEKTRKHCMLMENCNYDFFEMAVLNMVQKGMFGEVMHVEGAYIHDLRSMTYNDYQNDWRLHETKNFNGNIYPVHAIGPLSHVLNIHRGDKMNYLVSVSTAAVGNNLYAETLPANHRNKNEKMWIGDMNNTIIRTEKGKTILLQHDVTSPRPYDRLYKVSGTKGFAQKYPNLPANMRTGDLRSEEGLTVGSGNEFNGLAFSPHSHGFLNSEARNKVLLENQHPFVKKYGEIARKIGGHGGMDTIMDLRIIYCLNNGLPMDQDVYDAAEWSSIIPLTAKSVELGGYPVAIPDFTRGAWSKIKGVKYYTVDSETK